MPHDLGDWEGRAAMARSIHVFFYGLFMDVEALRANRFDPGDPRHAVVKGMMLCIGERATLVPEPSGSIPGVVMTLRHDEIDRLYAEPSVADYRPEAVMVEIHDGSIVAALCFNLPALSDASVANPVYAAKLRNLLMRLGLAADHLDLQQSESPTGN